IPEESTVVYKDFSIARDLQGPVQDIIDVYLDDMISIEHLSVEPFDIRLKEGTELKCPPMRRIPRCFRPFVEEETKRLMREGVIRKSSSWYHSPLVVVPKKGGKRRMCIDFRQLNAATIPFVHPLPRIDDCFESLSGAKVFGTLDLSHGFHQIPLKERITHLTAFCTSNDIFEYVRMPFGLANAPAHFQMVMNKVLRRLIGCCCIVYIDDVIVFGKTAAEFTQNLEKVLKCIAQIRHFRERKKSGPKQVEGHR
ncbi:hypothetical protein ADUPG1_001119, partial [Aduncisulcus paluster]